MVQASRFFREACEWTHGNVLESLESLWVKCLDDEDEIPQRGGAKRSRRRSLLSALESSDIVEMDLDDDKPLRKATYNDYYVNMESFASQWTLPYRQRTFSCQEIEMDAFVAIFVHRDIFSESPLLNQIMTSAPKDLWPNAEFYHRKIRAAIEAEREAEKASSEALAAAIEAERQAQLLAEEQAARAAEEQQAQLLREKDKKKRKNRRQLKKLNNQAHLEAEIDETPDASPKSLDSLIEKGYGQP